MRNTLNQRGQTLIETLVAIFILIMGIVSAVGLAIFSLNASTNITKQVIATGLAREGIEAVKNMRDTNWLNTDLKGNGCYSFVTGNNNEASCYQNWQSGPYDIQANPSSKEFVLDFTPGNPESSFWNLNEVSGGFGGRYALNYDGRAELSGFYTAAIAPSGTSDYYRKIIITEEDPNPYSNDPLFRRLLVTSQVWWKDKQCPTSGDWPGEGKCSVQLETYLTNWKTY